MRTILLNIVSSIGCTVLILTQKPHLPPTPPLKPDTISAESQKISLGKNGAYLFPASNIDSIIKRQLDDPHPKVRTTVR